MFMAQPDIGRCSHETTFTAPVKVRTGRTVTYENMTIYYDSSSSPVFTVSGSLRLINCEIIPLREPIDLIESNGGSVFLKNVTVSNPVFNNTTQIIQADSADITLIDSSFKGFNGFETWWTDDMYISNCSFNITGMIRFEANNNLTITDSRFDLYTNQSTTFLNIRFSERSRFYDNSISLPASTAERLGAWLVAVDFFRSQDIVFADNEVRNAGKVFVANGCTDVVVRNNTMANDEYVNSELQITGGSRNVLIAYNKVWNLHDSFEVYDHENITIIGNHVTTDVLGFYIKPSNRTAPTEVYILNNTQIGGSVSIQYTKGMVIDGNKFIDTVPIHLKNNTGTIFTNNQLSNSSLENWDTFNTTVDGNTVFMEPGFRWLGNDNSTIIMGENTVHVMERDAPVIANIKIEPSTPKDNESITIRADVSDDSGIHYVKLHSRIDLDNWNIREMTHVSGDRYETEIGPYANNTKISLYVSAMDASYLENIGVEDNFGKYYEFQVLVIDPKPIVSLIETPDQIPVPDSKKEIPGNQLESLTLGIVLGSIILSLRNQKTKTYNPFH